MLIPCPICGPRDKTEFAYGGPVRALPELDGNADMHVWRKALYSGCNPCGPMAELWFHASGCETWTVVTRDTVTHEVTISSLPDPKARET